MKKINLAFILVSYFTISNGMQQQQDPTPADKRYVANLAARYYYDTPCRGKIISEENEPNINSSAHEANSKEFYP